MAYIPASNSVVAFQSDPTKLVGTVSVVGTLPVVLNNSSIISVNQGSIAAVIVGGSIAASFTPPANQSVSGIVGASIIGNVNTTITSLATIGGFLNVNLVGGSILTSSTPNQSISGTLGASIIGLTPVNVTNFPTTQNISGSVAATQGTTPWQVVSSLAGGIFPISGSVAAVITNTNTNVSGSVAAWLNSSNASIITVGSPVANQSVSGSIGASIIGLTPVQVPGSVAVAIVSGSIAVSVTPPANQSVSGTVGASIIGTIPVTQGGTWIASVFGNMSVIGTVPVTQSGIWTASIVGQGPAAALTNGWPIINGEAVDSTGTFTNATQTTSVTNNNLDGYGNSLISINGTYGTATAIFEGSDDGGTTWFTVAAARDDTNVIETGYTSLTNISRSWQVNNSGFDSIRVRSTAVASGTVNARISSSSAPNSSGATVAIGAALPSGTAMLGSIAAYQGLTPWTINSVYGNISGSVVAFQGTSPWVVNFQNSSLIAINAGSVVTLSQGSVVTVFQSPSIVGTYAEDAPSASGDKGFLVMGARNDTLASVTSNDGDYSSHVVGPAGELIAANAPFTKWVQGNISVLSNFGTSVTAIAAQGASIFTYITGVQVANMSGASVLVTLSGATSSVIGYTIAPPGGGSNMVFPNALKTNANGAFTASVSGVSSIYLSAQGFISKT